MSSVTLLGTLCVLAGTLAAAYALWRRRDRRVSDLRQALELAYLDTRPEGDVGTLLARSGAFAERALRRTSLLAHVRQVLDRSTWQISAGELLFISALAGAGGVLLGVLGGSPILAVVMGAVGLFGPYVVAARSGGTRLRRFEEQFPDILDMVAASLESGASVSQAFEIVVAEMSDPAAEEFARVLAGQRVGVPLVDGLQEMAQRLGSRDVSWTVQAIVVQQRTGGRLAEVLRIVAGVMRSREEIRREVSALTAEGRLSAYVLTGLPVVFTAFLALVRPQYLEPLHSTGLGLVLLGTATALLIGAYVVMMKLVKIEV